MFGASGAGGGYALILGLAPEYPHTSFLPHPCATLTKVEFHKE